jgi:pSer/pThr/pTyr-binding forkhead associated (FHA) protein
MMFRLVITDQRGSRSVSLDRTPFTIGRSSENHLQLADAQVSRNHAELSESGTSWRVRDCGSRYGTLLNGTRVDESVVTVGDRLQLGQPTSCSSLTPRADSPPASSTFAT